MQLSIEDSVTTGGHLVEEAHRLGALEMPDKFEYTIKFPFRNFELSHTVEVVYPEEIVQYVEQLEALFGTPKAAVAPPAAPAAPAAPPPTNPPAPAPAGAPAPQADGPPLCPVHQVAMQPSKQSHSTWYCNKRDDTTSNGWCAQSI